MNAPTLIAHRDAAVEEALVETFAQQLEPLFADPPTSGRAAEEAVWKLLLVLGQTLLTALLALACWRVTQRQTRESEAA